MKQSIKPDVGGWTPLLAAAANNSASIDTLKYLIMYGADEGVANPAGIGAPGLTLAYFNWAKHSFLLNHEPPLILAVKSDDPVAVALLLKNSVDITLKDKEGKTALDHAKAQGNEAIIQLLTPKVESP